MDATVVTWELEADLSKQVQAAARAGRCVRAERGDAAGWWTTPPALVIRGVDGEGAAKEILAMRVLKGGAAVPVLAVMRGALLVDAVAGLRAAGVVRVMMVDELVMELPVIMKAVG